MEELAGKRILVVEDDVVNMAVFAVTLRRCGAIILQDPMATNTVKLLETYLPIDIVILDLMLRYQGSGYSIFDKIRSIPTFASLPIVLVTASDPAVEIPKAKQKGFSGFIGKPINPEKFPAQVAACIRGEPVWYAPNGGDY